ncbi:hypothetical protein AS9A_0339 [Hoyosella subflava DQS3-9A1]|uniref:Uncharacterized protein n=1 Tax=Hoyosella subflava (strain DSM 45089 / JCM 17490 / NBRC 109087 / DQS3-9A1) TaxID=443218 RepID=F6EGX4_HOYSD|nr:hypothetical protein AS9A_0339 [Hoyosella subflava DQS3-9A1]
MLNMGHGRSLRENREIVLALDGNYGRLFYGGMLATAGPAYAGFAEFGHLQANERNLLCQLAPHAPPGMAL